MSEKIIVASDHAGFAMKEYLKSELKKRDFEVEDAGTYNTDSVDYPVYAAKLSEAVASGAVNKGVLVCGSGIGASMTANRFKGVRAALCTSVEMAKLSRMHNDANVLVVGGRLTSEETASLMLDAWLTTEFEGGRHQNRITLMDSVNGEEESNDNR